MRIHRPALAAALLVLALGATACRGDRADGADGGATAQDPRTNDVGPLAYDRVPEGGTLRWPLSQLPNNFNYNHVDGTLTDGRTVLSALLPRIFLTDAAGVPQLNPDYLDGADVVTEPKQVVTLTLNPRARWSDGQPITWRDFAAQWRACNGTAKGFTIAAANGYDRIESVTRGVDDREVVIAFRNPYADWQSIFELLYPASANVDAPAFNSGWAKRPLVSAGPFRFAAIDRSAHTLTLVRDDEWWGQRAKLDSIVFRALGVDGQIDALTTGEIDLLDVGPDPSRLARAQSVPGVTIRRAAGPNYRQLTFNGTRPLLGDVRVRKALSKAVDRAEIARALLGPLGVPAEPLNNHLFMANQEGYRDNAGDVGVYDPAAARRLLDQAGWTADGDVRTRDGQELRLRLVIPSEVAASKQEADLIRSMLARVGVDVRIQPVDADDFFDKYVTPGNFDLTVFSWLGTPFPISSSESVYASPKQGPDGLDVRQNFARIGSPEIDALFTRATAELDRRGAIRLANEADRAIWAEVPSLTLYQRPELVAVKTTLVNVGARGFEEIRYERIGFTG